MTLAKHNRILEVLSFAVEAMRRPIDPEPSGFDLPPDCPSGMAAVLWYHVGMTPKITEEMRRALEESPGQPVTVEDDRTQKVYVLIGQESLPSLWEGYVQREVERGLAAVDRGEVVAWDPEKLKAEGRRALSERPPHQ